MPLEGDTVTAVQVALSYRHSGLPDLKAGFSSPFFPFVCQLAQSLDLDWFDNELISFTWFMVL